MRDVSGTVVDALIIVYLVFRLLHLLIHIAGLNPMFQLFSLISCLVALTVLALSFQPAG